MPPENTQTPSDPGQIPTDSAPIPQMPGPTPPQPGSKKVSWLLIAIAIITVIILAGVVWFMFYNNSSTRNLSSSSSNNPTQSNQPNNASPSPASLNSNISCGTWPQSAVQKPPSSLTAISDFPSWFPAGIPKDPNSTPIAYNPNEGYVKLGHGTGTLWLCSSASVQTISNFYNNNNTDQWKFSSSYNPDFPPQSSYVIQALPANPINSSQYLTILLYRVGDKILTVINYYNR